MRISTRAPVIHDVARLAGVSHQTVSRVMNQPGLVRASTRERVLTAMQQLNYRPNAIARALASRRSRAVGVISFDTRRHGPASTLLAIERAARLAGYSVTLCSLASLDAQAVHEAVDRLTEQGVDGLIVIAPSEASARGVQGLPATVPIVAVEAGRGPDVPVVSVDQLLGARLATDHLLDLGHRAVWHVAGPVDWLEAQERIEGWQSSLSEAGLAAPPVLRGDWSPHSGYRAGLSLAEENATAVFVANDQMALGLLYALHERGLRVPQDISVVGFDDVPEAAYFNPPLTTVRQDFDEVGRRGLRLLVELMDTPTVDVGARPIPERIAPTLLLRHSTGPAARRRARRREATGAADPAGG